MARKAGIIALCGLMSCAGVNTAIAGCMSEPDGWYVEGNVGSSHISGQSYPPTVAASQSGVGWNVNLGYKFLPYIAAEMGYSQYANNNLEDDLGATVAKNRHYSYDLALRGILPFWGPLAGLEIFAKVGAGRMNSHISIYNPTLASLLGISDTENSATNYYVGAGIQYYVLPELALVVQWQRAQGNSGTGTGDLFTGGLSFILS